MNETKNWKPWKQSKRKIKTEWKTCVQNSVWNVSSLMQTVTEIIFPIWVIGPVDVGFLHSCPYKFWSNWRNKRGKPKHVNMAKEIKEQEERTGRQRCEREFLNTPSLKWTQRKKRSRWSITTFKHSTKQYSFRFLCLVIWVHGCVKSIHGHYAGVSFRV